jgi:ribosomal protein S18 acetylase RimI-like enzyme
MLSSIIILTVILCILTISTSLNANLSIRKLEFNQYFQLNQLLTKHFITEDIGFTVAIATRWKIAYFTFLKLAFGEDIGHSVFGAFDESKNRLIGCVDLSLQLNSGSLEALKVSILTDRMELHADRLEAYLCNLLVDENYRRNGIASLLIDKCAQEAARSLNSTRLNLHVDIAAVAAIALYQKNGFCVVKKASEDVFFMSKMISGNA